NQELPRVAATSATAAAPAPIKNPKAIHKRLGDSGRDRRRSVNWSITASRARDATCPSCHWPMAAQVALIKGATAATTICHPAGGGLSAVRITPAAKQPRKPSSSASGWRKERYASTPVTGS